jgi:hypothetical protein
MSAVLLGIFDELLVAERARIALVRDGFATDRVDVTAGSDQGRAAHVPAASAQERFFRHFWTVLGSHDVLAAEQLATAVSQGAAVVTVHPRGATETARATQLLAEHGMTELLQHDLGNQRLERAAADRDSPAWVRHLWIETRPDTDCLYCRLRPSKLSRMDARG